MAPVTSAARPTPPATPEIVALVAAEDSLSYASRLVHWPFSSQPVFSASLLSDSAATAKPTPTPSPTTPMPPLMRPSRRRPAPGSTGGGGGAAATSGEGGGA